MKTIFNKFLAGTMAVLSLTACTGDFEDINGNDYQPDNLDADNYALSSAMYAVFGRVIPSDINMTQFTDCLLGGETGGYFASANSGFRTNQISAFNMNNGWTRVFMEANPNSIIPTIYVNLAIIEGYSETSGNMLPAHIAKLVKVAAMSRVTDCYGPIPYSKIGFDGSILTPYDSQEEVYNKFFEEIDECIAGFNECMDNVRSPLIDDVYQTDPAKWIKFANSLKLRFAMRLSYVNPSLAKQKAEEAVAGGVIESNADNAMYDHYKTGGNPIYSATIGYNNDSRPSAEICCYMNGYNDPRRAVYFTTASNGTYVGIRRGWNNVPTFSLYSGLNIKASDPSIWMTAAEVAFLRAEGVAVFGWSMGGTAEALYNEGIRLSFEQNGVDGYADYIADDTSKPAQYTCPDGSNPYNGVYSTITIKWDDAASTEEKQERIITQKWIANMYLGNEAWADKRRTGYPQMFAPEMVNLSGGVTNPAQGAQRMPYPQEEYTNNSANIMAAVRDYLGGPDNMGTKLWWACKPGL